jgi:hypothetical protein
MGLTLILFIIAAVFAFIGYKLYVKGEESLTGYNDMNITKGLGCFGWFVSGLTLLLAVGFTIGIACSPIMMDVDIQKRMYERGSIERQLKEQDAISWQNTLNAALEFNIKEKTVALENSTFYYKYWSRPWYVDTIEIPQNKTTSRSIVKLEKE